MFLKKISHVESRDKVHGIRYCVKRNSKKPYFCLSKPMLNQRYKKPILSNFNIEPTTNKYLDAKSSTILKECLKINEDIVQFLAFTTKSDLVNSDIPICQPIFYLQNYKLLNKTKYYYLSKGLHFEEWSFTFSAKDFVAKELLDGRLDTCLDYSRSIQFLQDKPNIHTVLLKQNERKTNGDLYSFKQTFESSFWKLPDIDRVDPNYFELTEKFDSRIFFCKKLPLVAHQKLQPEIKFKMWEIKMQMLKKMCWKVFTLDPRANLLTKETFQKADFSYFLSLDSTFSKENIFSYIFQEVMDFRIPLKNINTGCHKQETFLYKCENKDEDRKSFNLILDLKDDELDLLVLNKNASVLKSSYIETTIPNHDNTNVAVNESTFYFDSISVTNSALKSSIKCRSRNFVPRLFCNFDRLNKKILQKLYHSNQITVFEGEDKDFADLKCQMILNQKSCIFFIKCMEFIQINPKTNQLYIYQEVMHLCKIFENIYIVFTDCEDQPIERLQKCKLALLENFQQFSRIHIFEVESNYYESDFTDEILIPSILQNSIDCEYIMFNYLIEDNETVYELLAIGFDLFTSNILSLVNNLINKIINNNLTDDERTIVTQRIHDKILRYLND